MLSIEAHHKWVINGKPRFGDIWLNKTKCHTEYKKAIKLSNMRVTKIFTNKLLDKLLSKNTSKFWSLLRSKTNNNNSSSSNLTADQISEKFKTNFIDSASNNDSVANFLHNLGNIKYEHFDPGIDVECLEKCLSHLNNSSCVDAYGLSKCHIVYAHEMLRVILVK